MKSWQFWVLILVFIFVVVPLIYFAVVAKNVAKAIVEPVPYTPIRPGNDLVVNGKVYN